MEEYLIVPPVTVKYMNEEEVFWHVLWYANGLRPSGWESMVYGTQ